MRRLGLLFFVLALASPAFAAPVPPELARERIEEARAALARNDIAEARRALEPLDEDWLTGALPGDESFGTERRDAIRAAEKRLESASRELDDALLRLRFEPVGDLDVLALDAVQDANGLRSDDGHEREDRSESDKGNEPYTGP